MDILSCRLFYDWTAQDCQQGFGTYYRQWSNFRLTRGIYYYLKIDEILGFGVLYPSIEEIAESIARRDNVRIVPTGIYALNMLGLSTQVPMNFVYISDGSRRNIDLGEGKSIQFKLTSPSNLNRDIIAPCTLHTFI